MWYRHLTSNRDTSRTKRCKSQAKKSDILLELGKNLVREFKIKESYC